MREICKKVQHFEVASWYSGFDRPIVYTALIPNWCFWETPPMSDVENFLICPTRLQPSAVMEGCKIIFQRKRMGENRGWKHRAEEISKELMGCGRMDNIGMTNISAEGDRACQSIFEDCTTILSEAAFKQNGVYLFPLPIFLSLPTFSLCWHCLFLSHPENFKPLLLGSFRVWQNLQHCLENYTGAHNFLSQFFL